MRRRSFIRLLGTATVAGSVAGRAGAVATPSGVSEVQCYASSSLLDANGEVLTDEDRIVLWAEETGSNKNVGSEDDAVLYGDTQVPTVAIDDTMAGNVVGLGSTLVADRKEINRFDNAEFYLNAWDELLDGTTVLWDETHDQYWDLERFQTFQSTAQARGYDVRASNSLFEDLDGAGADAIVIQPPERDIGTWDTPTLKEFVESGGTIFLHNQSDHDGFGQADRLNAVCEDLGVQFRFNSDQVVDYDRNDGMPWRVTTGAFNTEFPFFEGGDEDGPTAGFTVSRASVGPGQAVEFDASPSESEDAWIYSYEWEFGDGTTGDGEIVSHTYREAGDFTVTLTIEDLDGNRASASKSIRVTDRLQATVKRVSDGDSLEVTMPDGTEESVRMLGHDTPESPDAEFAEREEEWWGIDDIELLQEWSIRATEFAEERLGPGTSVELEFDPESARRDPFDRLLTYVYYDATGDGNHDTEYVRETIEEGMARVYHSGFARHDDYWRAEVEARANGRGLWGDAATGGSGEFRNHAVQELFVPKPVPVVTDATGMGGEDLPAESRVPVHAEPTARAQGMTDYDRIPVVAVDEDARVGLVSGHGIDENYEKDSGFNTDISEYGNFPFLTNLIDYLSENAGEVAVDGGHGQFPPRWSMSREQTSFYHRHLEGQGIVLSQYNDLENADLRDTRAVLVASPAAEFSRAEIRALQEFRDEGGAVVMMTDSDATPAARDRLGRLARELDTDLRFGHDAVRDETNSIALNPAFPVTANFDREFPLFMPHDGDGGGGGGGGGGGDGVSDRYTGRLAGSGDGETFSHSVEADDPGGVTVTLDGPDGDGYGSGADFDLYLTLDGREPTQWDYDLQSAEAGADQRIEIEGYRVGGDTELGILVRSYTGSGEFVLRVDEDGA